MTTPGTYTNPLHGVASEIIAAMSALNMEPAPIQDPQGIFLSQTDAMAAHAMEHLHAAMENLRKVQP